MKQKLPPLEVLIDLCREHGVQEVADMYGTSRQAVYRVFKDTGVTVPEREAKKTAAPLQDRLIDALLYVLGGHPAPGDPYYDYARKRCPEIVPEREAFKFREDEVS